MGDGADIGEGSSGSPRMLVAAVGMIQGRLMVMLLG